MEPQICRKEAPMIQGTFDIAVDTPKRHKLGTLALKSEGERIIARLVIGDELDMEFGGSCADKEFDFAGTAEIPDHDPIEYSAHGSTWGNSISVTCQSNIGAIEIFGTRLSTSAGEFKSSHDYIMSASNAEFDNNDSTMYSGLYADGG